MPCAYTNADVNRSELIQRRNSIPDPKRIYLYNTEFFHPSQGQYINGDCRGYSDVIAKHSKDKFKLGQKSTPSTKYSKK